MISHRILCSELKPFPNSVVTSEIPVHSLLKQSRNPASVYPLKMFCGWSTRFFGNVWLAIDRFLIIHPIKIWLVGGSSGNGIKLIGWQRDVSFSECFTNLRYFLLPNWAKRGTSIGPAKICWSLLQSKVRAEAIANSLANIFPWYISYFVKQDLKHSTRYNRKFHYGPFR